MSRRNKYFTSRKSCISYHCFLFCYLVVLSRSNLPETEWIKKLILLHRVFSPSLTQYHRIITVYFSHTQQLTWAKLYIRKLKCEKQNICVDAYMRRVNCGIRITFKKAYRFPKSRMVFFVRRQRRYYYLHHEPTRFIVFAHITAVICELFSTHFFVLLIVTFRI